MFIRFPICQSIFCSLCANHSLELFDHKLLFLKYDPFKQLSIPVLSRYVFFLNIV